MFIGDGGGGRELSAEKLSHGAMIMFSRFVAIKITICLEEFLPFKEVLLQPSLLDKAKSISFIEASHAEIMMFGFSDVINSSDISRVYKHTTSIKIITV